MKSYLVLCVTLNLLNFLSYVSSEATLTPKYDKDLKQAVQFLAKHTATLSCLGTDLPAGSEVKWEKGDTPIEQIENLKSKAKTYKKDNTFTLEIKDFQDDDAGNYTCFTMQNDEKVAAVIQLASKIVLKIPTNINVVEGEKLRIHCQVFGRPVPTLEWLYKNETYNHTYTQSEDRVILKDDEEKSIPNAVLFINEIQMFDRGTFQCIGKWSLFDKDIESVESMIRVKDKYAALWPFLGICAEVFVLCGIIFIYEKKRNKTELEESDTDQSPDQKNTPDHGKEQNLRHRQQ